VIDGKAMKLWYGLGEDERKPYEGQAAEDKIRYKHELAQAVMMGSKQVALLKRFRKKESISIYEWFDFEPTVSGDSR
jgi:hypothetical protein